MKRFINAFLFAVIVPSFISLSMAQVNNQKTEYTDFENDSLYLESVEVSAQNGAKVKMNLTTNTELIGVQQLVRAACCNLGESFTTNPSVDVSYSDAATGAKQIKLLGLSGTYVQMLTENVPNLRGAAIPYSLGYIPGPWMQAIQVSKGASSVKNGYESTTGQINIEFLKPQGVDGVRGNFYYDTQQKFEGNLDGSIHLTDELSTSLLLHYEDRQKEHDGNKDGFMDMPKIRQYDIMDRWAYVSPKFISQLFVKVLNDERNSGQSLIHSLHNTGTYHGYGISIETNRYEVQWKNAIITNADKNASVALMLHGSYHDADNTFGYRKYDVTQKNGYAQLMYETDITERHNISVGASMNDDWYKENYIFDVNQTDKNSMTEGIDYYTLNNRELTIGTYAQYTYKIDEIFTLMAGARIDLSNIYDLFFTPRLHLKYSPTEWFSFRASAGKGYRSPHALAENVPLLASGRPVYIRGGHKSDFLTMQQEEAWNYGTSLNFNIPIGEKNLELNAEYYYTDFINQMVVKVRDNVICFENLRQTKDNFIGGIFKDGKSYSHTIQVDATYPLFEGLTATAAWRFNDARTTYDGELRWRPFTNRYKGLLTLSYKTPLEIWQFDITGQLIGHGEKYDGSRYPSYGQLQAQITRDFQYFSIYIGGENLTGYKMREPIIIGAHDPFGPNFDATQVWGPTEGAMGYIGIRFKFEKN